MNYEKMVKIYENIKNKSKKIVETQIKQEVEEENPYAT